MRPLLALLALVAIAASMAIWVARKPIASHLIDRALAARGVPARYRIEDLGLGRQRLVDVVIGDSARPDLVADWLELETRVGLSGPVVTGVRAGPLRLRGRLIDGKVTLGAIDRLMPAPSGQPFRLPHLRLDLADARMRLETPQGAVGLKLAGAGLLDDGFAGTLAAVSERLTLGGCAADRLAAVVRIRIAAARPILSGPLRAATLTCGDLQVRAARATLDATVDAALERTRGSARVALGSVAMTAGRVADLAGTASFDGDARQATGRIALRSGAFDSATAAGAALSLTGSYRTGQTMVFGGTLGATRAALSPRLGAQIDAIARQGAGTPLAPLAAKAGQALHRAAQSLSLTAAVDVAVRGGRGAIRLGRAELVTASGARASFAGDGARFAWPGAVSRIDGRLVLAGGGLPEATLDLAQAKAGAPIVGIARFRPYAAPGAMLALTPLRFTATPHGNSVFAGRVTFSGPLGDGRIERASVEIAGLWNGRARLLLNPECAPLSFESLALSGLKLDPASIRLCPVDGALFRIEGARIAGGARLAATRLTGTLGATPLSLAVRDARLGLADRRFGATGVAVRIGPSERMTAFDFANIDGAVSERGLAGSFAGGGGQIANVPLRVSAAAGDWTLANATLALTGTLGVADAAAIPRFAPLVGRDVRLSLANRAIAVTGTLVTPEALKVADLSIAHDLGRGTGHAELTMPGLTFSKALQPDRLTPLTYGVIADVVGTVAGRGRIDWTPAAVTSTGAFHTDGIDLAAAFGPVTGIQGEVRFTDLLNMVTAPGQIVKVATVNPGIPVESGTIRYHLLPGMRVAVEGGSWPFAGGQLALDRTTLDFAESAERHVTFRVTGLDAEQFLQQFDFKNLNATGRFDGVLPMVFDQQGGRIEGGHLTVRDGGGTIAYVGEVSQKDIGLWGNLAFQALKALDYRRVEILMNGPLVGEMVTEVRFAGVSQGAGTKTNFLLRRLARLPFVFNVRIQAPFRGLIDSARSFYDPHLLIQRNLPALLRERERVKALQTPIQAPESEKLP